MFHSNLNWDRIPTKIKRAMEASLEHLDEHKFVLNDTNIEIIDDYCWDLSKKCSRVTKQPNELLLLVTCYLKQLLYMNLAHNKLISKSQTIDKAKVTLFPLELSSHISSLTHLQSLNLTNNHLEVYLRRQTKDFLLTPVTLGVTQVPCFTLSPTHSQVGSQPSHCSAAVVWFIEIAGDSRSDGQWFDGRLFRQRFLPAQYVNQSIGSSSCICFPSFRPSTCSVPWRQFIRNISQRSHR